MSIYLQERSHLKARMPNRAAKKTEILSFWEAGVDYYVRGLSEVQIMDDDNVLVGDWRNNGDAPRSLKNASKAKLIGMVGSTHILPFDDAQKMQKESGSSVAMQYAWADLEKALKASNQLAIDHWTQVIKHLDEMERN